MNTLLKKVNIVLLVDDDEDDRKMFQEALQAVDTEVEYLEARDGVEALELLTRQPTVLPDFIFLDLNMPRKDGKQLLADLQKHQHLHHIAVIVYTTSKSIRDVEEVKSLGAAHFITKPFFFEEICSAIRLVLARKW